MIAFFGTYAQAKEHSKATGVPLKDFAIMDVNPERLEGKTEPITVYVDKDYPVNQGTEATIQMIQMFNNQFEALKEQKDA